jgi:hypothetical protein
VQIGELHPWDVTPAEARRIQADLAARIVLEDAIASDDVRTVAGVDNTYVKEGDEMIAHAVVVVLTFPGLEVIETAFASRPVTFPYVPGLLSFREAPAVLGAFGRVDTAPDVVLFDGQGYAHPRRFGLASHLGLLLDRRRLAEGEQAGDVGEGRRPLGEGRLDQLQARVGEDGHDRDGELPPAVAEVAVVDAGDEAEVVRRDHVAQRHPGPEVALDPVGLLRGHVPAVEIGDLHGSLPSIRN